MGLDHPERVTLYVNNFPGKTRVFGYKVLSDGIDVDWVAVCGRVREWERDSKIKNLKRLLCCIQIHL